MNERSDAASGPPALLGGGGGGGGGEAYEVSESSGDGCVRRGIWLPRRAPHASAYSRMEKVSVWLEQAVDARDDGSGPREDDIATTERLAAISGAKLAAISGANQGTPSPLMTPDRMAILRRLYRAAAAALEKESEGAEGIGSAASPQLQVSPAATPATPAAAAALSPQLQVQPAATSKSRTIGQV